MFRTILLALVILATPAAVLATEMRIHNAASVPLVHVHAVPDGTHGDGPDHFDGQALAPGEEIRIEIPGDACRLRLRLVWLSGASADMAHDACADDGPLVVRTR